MLKRVTLLHSVVLIIFVCLVTSSAAAQQTWYVDDDAPALGSGDSWDSPFRFLRDALSSAVSGDEIRVAQGIYYPDRDEKFPSGSGLRSDTFSISDSLTLQGGYAGFGAADPDERNIAAFPTVLSGEINGPDPNGQ